jgi:uncharacterized protein
MKGRFVWHDYLARERQAAIDFYTHVVGWRTQPFDAGEGPVPYIMWAGDQGPLGGVMPLQDEAGEGNGPSHWMGHIQVEDVDAIVQAVQAAGGAVRVPPTPIPSVGRFSVVADPQGAVLSVFRPDMSEAPHDKSRHGEVDWAELHVADPGAAFEFYSGLFGWEKKEELDMGPAGKYTIFGIGDRLLGGMMWKDDDMPMPPSWIYYVLVDDLDAALERAKARDARILHGPVPLPDGSRMAQLVDPQGAVFGLNGQ